ncbi:MAG: bifunctional 3-deoxy-7-phosphoheptulonate synthase/chorismate mutase [Bacteroidota bacterium]
MIIHLTSSIDGAKAAALAQEISAIHLVQNDTHLLVTSSKVKELPAAVVDVAEAFFPMDTDLQLASRDYRKETRTIELGDVTIGGNTGNTVMITGPCSVESEEQVDATAQFAKEMGVKVFRGGAYKPRTSPYSFQGLGLEGLKLLALMRERYGFQVITEVRDATHVDDVIAYTDIIQIGAKAMYDHGILRACGKAAKPVLLKRGFGSTLQEFVQAAEFVLSGGNEHVMLCERGIRTFETKTRFTLDLCGVSFLKEYTNLPVILDTSHAMGYRYGVPDLTRACVAMGVDGLLIETHPNPAVALSDAAQQLDFEQFRALYETLPPVASAVGRKIV